MIPAAVRYVRPPSLDSALEALAEPNSTALAGGQSLVPALKLRLARPSTLVDIGRLDGLAGVDVRDGEVWIGPLTTWDALEAAEELRVPALAAIPECAAGIGDLQVRSRGTIGGSLAHAHPASDMSAVLLALGARVVVRSVGGERTVACAELVRGPFTTVLDSGELITAIAVPVPAPGAASAYVAVEHPASGFALAGAAALVRADGSRSVAITGVGGQPSVIPNDGELTQITVFGDRFAPAEYRRHLAGVVVRRAHERAAERAREAS